jgi:hypothetical protein
MGTRFAQIEQARANGELCLSDLETRFSCQGCGLPGADVGLDFDRKKQLAGGMGYR